MDKNIVCSGCSNEGFRLVSNQGVFPEGEIEYITMICSSCGKDYHIEATIMTDLVIIDLES